MEFQIRLRKTLLYQWFFPLGITTSMRYKTFEIFTKGFYYIPFINVLLHITMEKIL